MVRDRDRVMSRIWGYVKDVRCIVTYNHPRKILIPNINKIKLNTIKPSTQVVQNQIYVQYHVRFKLGSVNWWENKYMCLIT